MCTLLTSRAKLEVLLTMPPRFIARQLSHPTGFFGRIMERLMNMHNAKLNSYAVRQLELKPSDRILEIGFVPKERMDRMGMPADIFTLRAPDDVVAALRKAGFSDVRIEQPKPTTRWNVLVATR